MSKIFVDTSGWAEYLVAGQPRHTAAVKILRPLQSQRTGVVTTNYVLAELVALLHSPIRLPRPQALIVLDGIRSASWVEIVHIDSGLDARAWELLRVRPDKSWSLVDCTSFVLMQERGIQDALTTDQHFVQAGQTRLLQ